MAEEIGFENGRNSNFQGLVALTLTLDSAIRHTVVHHSSTSTYIPNFIQIEETFCGRTDGHTDGRTFSPSNIIRSTFGSRPKNHGGPAKVGGGASHKAPPLKYATAYHTLENHKFDDLCDTISALDGRNRRSRQTAYRLLSTSRSQPVAKAERAA